MIEEQQYLNLLQDIIEHGYDLDDRTGVGSRCKIGVQQTYNLRNNILPVITTRRTFIRGAIEELLWILRGDTDAKILQDKKIHIWDGNTTEEFIKKRGLSYVVPVNSIGTLYGFQVRNWGGDWNEWIKNKKRTGIDQLARVVELLKNDPSSRRILISNYNVSQLDTGVLEPCHTLYSFNVDVKRKELHSLLWMRSVDLACGYPLNIIHIALLTHILAKMIGYTAGDFTFQAANAHVYNNHIPQLKEQIQRVPYWFPTIEIKKDITSISDIESLTFEDFVVKGYVYHPPIKYEMAV